MQGFVGEGQEWLKRPVSVPCGTAPITSERPYECLCRFVVVSVLGTRFQTPVLKRNINPIYPAKDATFDFPIYLSLADKLGVVELVVWDKDMLKKDYMGEVALPLDEWFRQDGVYAFDDPDNKVLKYHCSYLA